MKSITGMTTILLMIAALVGFIVFFLSTEKEELSFLKGNQQLDHLHFYKKGEAFKSELGIDSELKVGQFKLIYNKNKEIESIHFDIVTKVNDQYYWYFYEECISNCPEEAGTKLKKVVQETAPKEVEYDELIPFGHFLNQITFLASRPSIMYENDDELLSYLLVKKAGKSVIALPGDYYQLESMQLKKTSQPRLEQKFHYVSIIGRKSTTPNYNFSTYEHNTKNILLLQEN